MSSKETSSDPWKKSLKRVSHTCERVSRIQVRRQGAKLAMDDVLCSI